MNFTSYNGFSRLSSDEVKRENHVQAKQHHVYARFGVFGPGIKPAAESCNPTVICCAVNILAAQMLPGADDFSGLLADRNHALNGVGVFRTHYAGRRALTRS